MGDERIPLTGVFATRSPDRPNPIGLHRVTVTALQPPASIHVDALEAIDGTPILDPKIAVAARAEALGHRPCAHQPSLAFARRDARPPRDSESSYTRSARSSGRPDARRGLRGPADGEEEDAAERRQRWEDPHSGSEVLASMRLLELVFPTCLPPEVLLDQAFKRHVVD